MVMRFFVKPFFASSRSRLLMSHLEKIHVYFLSFAGGSCFNFFFFYASVFHFSNANYLTGVHPNYSQRSVDQSVDFLVFGQFGQVHVLDGCAKFSGVRT